MISNEHFRAALSRFASGVTVVTTRSVAGERFGMTVSAFCSLSVEPPLILVCINKLAPSHNVFVERGAFVVNILGHGQRNVSEQLALPSGDKFVGLETADTEKGLPVVVGSLVSLECVLHSTYEGGDHSIMVGLVEDAVVHDEAPLVYFNGDYHRLADED